ncbi:hypothetical protein VPH1254_0070 [Vibrio phage 1254]|nr:hypothetical protein SIPHO018v1_90003 [Vibrio phage 11E33.1]QZI92536.1 hypothetical protein SIPHO017v1_p0003 [Vibrio phage 19E33.1]QZI92791.1 hypothetical protein SIPHO016v1_p0012 [Vibrio phage 38E33.6a]QZI92979.1 hypothetical protein SIPHO015v1_p0041 [Vibrio phage 82E32.2]QZI93002.1 hypothetical protein SIPHO014v1_p0003 [Vibrio phage 82E32.3]QZI93111.1 hypothetical protein SIPHO013v1_p0050 [Vibrio phage 82E33.2]
MTTKFHALNLNERIVEIVTQLSSDNFIDLNSVANVQDRIIIGEPKCGKVIHVQFIKAGFGKPRKAHIGMYDLPMDRAIFRTVVSL